jgi:hypothetical protein
VILLAAREMLPLSFSKCRGDAGMIHFNCHACGRGLKAKNSQAGTSIQCGRCFAAVTVPSTNCPECGQPRRTTLLGRLLQCPCQTARRDHQKTEPAVPEWVAAQDTLLATFLRAYLGTGDALEELEREGSPELGRFVRGLLRDEDPEVFRDLMADLDSDDSDSEWLYRDLFSILDYGEEVRRWLGDALPELHRLLETIMEEFASVDWLRKRDASLAELVAMMQEDWGAADDDEEWEDE